MRLARQVTKIDNKVASGFMNLGQCARPRRMYTPVHGISRSADVSAVCSMIERVFCGRVTIV